MNFHDVTGTSTQACGLEQFTRRKVLMPKVIGKEGEGKVKEVEGKVSSLESEVR